jgi:hypothetical protein
MTFTNPEPSISMIEHSRLGISENEFLRDIVSKTLSSWRSPRILVRVCPLSRASSDLEILNRELRRTPADGVTAVTERC